jgi:integrase
VRITRDLAVMLDAHMADVLDVSDDAWVFASQIGGPLDADNLRKRVIKPLMCEIGAPWAAWRTLRHTYASLHLARGANIVQLSRALGHHSASFTLDTYIHLRGRGRGRPRPTRGGRRRPGQRRAGRPGR